jgi:hypothetical protein
MARVIEKWRTLSRFTRRLFHPSSNATTTIL